MNAKLFLICFNSVSFTKQATNVLTEVVPFCKSGHIYINTQVRGHIIRISVTLKLHTYHQLSKLTNNITRQSRLHGVVFIYEHQVCKGLRLEPVHQGLKLYYYCYGKPNNKLHYISQ